MTTTDNEPDPTPILSSIIGAGGHHVGGGDWDRGLPIDQPVLHRARTKPTGLDWGTITPAEPEATPPPPAMQAVVVPEGIDQAHWEDALAGETYDKPEPAPQPAADSKLRRGRGAILTPEQRVEIVHRYQLGESNNALCKAFGSHTKTINAVLTQAGVPIRNQSEAAFLRKPRDSTPDENSTTTTPAGHDETDIQGKVIADIAARRLTRSGRHSHTGPDSLVLLYHGLIDALLDLKQVLIDRDGEAHA